MSINNDENLKYNDEGYIHMHRIHKYLPKSEDGAYIIDSRKSKNKQKNYLSDEVKEKIKQFDDNLSFPEFIIEKEVEKSQKTKDIPKKKGKKKNNKNTKGIKKSPNHLRKMPFHPDKKIHKIIKEKFDKLKIKTMSNDIDFVDMLLHCYKGYIHYNVDESQFYWYTGKYWKRDNEYTVYNFAAKYVYEINRTLRKSNADKSALKQSSLYGNDRYIKNLLGMLKTRCVCHSEDFDKYPYLLNVHNGTVNLLTKKLQEHKPEDGITKFINVDYKSDAIGSRFPDFILEICDNDKELAKYLQVVYGYALTGETREQCIFIEKGYGANGKSTLNDVTSIVVEDYTDRVDFSLFQKKQCSSANAPTPELAKLKGKHIVFCSETDDNRLNEAKIKEITGGTKITARALRKDPFSYTPEFTIILDGNNLPTIKGSDYGIWRRIIVIPFNCKFSKDVTLKDNLLKEKEAILKWLIDGAIEYYQNGLPECKAVKKATKEYRAEENTVESFIKYGITEDSDKLCSANVLYLAYEKYCSNCGNTPVNIKAFKAAMTMNGYKNKRTNKGVFWIGICPRDDMK